MPEEPPPPEPSERLPPATRPELRLSMRQWMMDVLAAGSDWADVPGRHRRELLRIAREMAAMLRRL